MWGLLDANQDGGLDVKELKPLLAQLDKAREAKKVASTH
jgi:hypothetical protein